LQRCGDQAPTRTRAQSKPGWINTDSQPVATADYLDFTRPFPFAGDAFHAVFCEHTIEHIEKAEASRTIGEVFRVLRPGGCSG
jgi:predicted SAM-dependent methyltransferase